jgi:hypothetical protein
MGSANKAATVMFGYAAVLVATGVVAYSMAPEGANARTALVVPTVCAGLMVLSAILATRLASSRMLGMIGIHLGLVLPLLFAAGIGFRAHATGAAIDRHDVAQAEWNSAIAAGADASDQARQEFFAARDAPDHDKSYLRNTLWVLTVLSVGAFFGILATRPKKADRT